MFSNFSNNPELAQTVIIIGEWFNREGLAKEKTGLNNEAKVQFEKAVKVWNRVINELPQSDLIPEACCWAGDCYYKLNKYQESLQRFQKVTTEHESYKYNWHALFMVGRNYEGLWDSGIISETEANIKIKEAYTKLIEKYPASPSAQTAQIWIAANATE